MAVYVGDFFLYDDCQSLCKSSCIKGASNVNTVCEGRFLVTLQMKITAINRMEFRASKRI